MESPLPHGDLEEILDFWSTAITCPVWRLWGESPSVRLLEQVRSGVDHEVVLRDASDRLTGLLGVREASREHRFGYFTFILSPAAGGAPVLPFLTAARVALDLRTITVIVDADIDLLMLEDARPWLVPVGRLRDHALVGAGQYVDRLLFDFKGADPPGVLTQAP